MIIATVTSGKNTLVIELPRDKFDIAVKLHSIGINRMPNKVELTDDKDIYVRFSAESDIEKHLIKLFFRRGTLEDANKAVFKVMNAEAEIKPELEQNILDDHYRNVDELLLDIERMQNEVAQYTETFYFPLLGNLDEEDGYEPYEVDNSFLQCYKWDIEELIKNELESMNEDMKDFYYEDDDTQQKMLSAKWGIEEINDVLYGKTEIKLREPFTPVEKLLVKDWIEGQNSDGFGEGLEQRPIETEDGDLYVSMWGADNYFIYDSKEMENYLSQQQEGGISL